MKRMSRSRQLTIESLENRQLLTTFTVTNLQDNGPGSLRDAVEQSNQFPDADTIEFLSGLSGTIELTSGEILISDSLTLDGSAGNIVVDGTASSRIFNIENENRLNTVLISDLTIQNGRAFDNDVIGGRFGGGIINTESLELSNVVVRDSVASLRGGGILSSGDLRLSNGSQVVSNIAESSGGGIWSSGNLRLSNGSQVVSNIADGEFSGRGGGIYITDEQAIIEDSLISNNISRSSFRGGGGIFVDEASLTVIRSTISYNEAEFSDGGGVFFGRSGASGCDGGLTVVDSTLDSNHSAGNGGAIAVDCAFQNVELRNSTFSNNTSEVAGGALFYRAVASSVIEGATFHGNTSASGGAFAIDPNLTNVFSTIALPLVVRNSTFSQNEATVGEGGGLAIYPDESDFFDRIDYDLDIVSSTFVDNHAATTGGGIFSDLGNVQNVQIPENLDSFELINSIVAHNTSDGTSPDLMTDSLQSPHSVRYSLVGSNEGSFLAEGTDADSNVVGGATNGLVDPQLGPLADNGGPTLTHLPLSGPAIDSGDPSITDAFDQRGFDRIQNGTIDRGAVESGNSPPGDFDGNWELGCSDIDALSAESAAGTHGSAFDVTGDGLVNFADVQFWITSLRGTLIGDANLDGAVDVSDFNQWNDHKFTNTTNWCRGNFDGNGVVDTSDFNIWNSQKFQSVDSAIDTNQGSTGEVASLLVQRSFSEVVFSLDSKKDSHVGERTVSDYIDIVFQSQDTEDRESESHFPVHASLPFDAWTF